MATTKKTDLVDDRHMTAALGLAARGLGNVWPNPAVACILVQDGGGDGRVVGRGWTAPGGRPHAETQAIERAGADAKGATAYITLEPCAHHGETPPCAGALIEAGIARAVVAAEDPDPRVAGQGLAMLRDAGIAVDTGICRDRAEDLNAGFISRIARGRPLVTLKTATTLDGRIATGAGHSKWITGEAARDRVHMMRAQSDAVLTGIGTVLADDPQLTCRLPGMDQRSPLRIVADSRARTPLDAKLVTGARDVPTWIVTATGADSERRRALGDAGVEIIALDPGADGRPDLARLLNELGSRGLTRLMVECGGTLAAALFELGLIDRLAWFRSAKLFGGDGVAMAGAFGVAQIGDAPAFERKDIVDLGDDTLETYVIRA